MHPELNLLKEFTLSKFRESNYNSILGPLWSLLHPVIMLFVLYSLFAARFGKSIEGYPIYLLVGIVCVGFLSNAVARAMPLLTFAQQLLLNSRTRGITIIFSDLITAGSKFLLEIGLCIFLSALSGSFSAISLLSLILLIFAFCAMVTGLSLSFALRFCIVRDLQYIWGFVGQILLFATPVFYSLNDLSEWARFIVYWFNPLTPFVLAFRSIFIDHNSPQLSLLIHCLCIGLCFITIGLFLFNRFNRVMIERA